MRCYLLKLWIYYVSEALKLGYGKIRSSHCFWGLFMLKSLMLKGVAILATPPIIGVDL